MKFYFYYFLLFLSFFSSLLYWIILELWNFDFVELNRNYSFNTVFEITHAWHKPNITKHVPIMFFTCDIISLLLLGFGNLQFLSPIKLWQFETYKTVIIKKSTHLTGNHITSHLRFLTSYFNMIFTKMTLDLVQIIWTNFIQKESKLYDTIFLFQLVTSNIN